jgi:hypothetical protein
LDFTCPTQPKIVAIQNGAGNFGAISNGVLSTTNSVNTNVLIAKIVDGMSGVDEALCAIGECSTPNSPFPYPGQTENRSEAESLEEMRKYFGGGPKDLLVLTWDGDFAAYITPGQTGTAGHVVIATKNIDGAWEMVLSQFPMPRTISPPWGPNIFENLFNTWTLETRVPDHAFVVTIPSFDGFCCQAEANLAIANWRPFPVTDCSATNYSTSSVRSLISGGYNIPRNDGALPDYVRDYLIAELDAGDPLVSNGMPIMIDIFSVFY